LDTFELLISGVIGLFTGLVGGMLGVGGSIVMIPAMTELLGPDQHLYQAAAMIVNFFVVVPAVYQHRRARAIDMATISRILPLASLSVVLGVGISELSLFAGAGEVYLRGLFGLFLFLIAVTDLYRLCRRHQHNVGALAGQGRRTLSSSVSGEPKRMQWRFAAVVAVPTGLVAGLLGVGGGVMAVPLQRRLLRVPVTAAIAGSATIIIATSFVGAIVKNYAYITRHDGDVSSLTLAAIVIPTAVIGSLIGSALTHRVAVRIVRAGFFLLLLLASLRFMYTAVCSM